MLSRANGGKFGNIQLLQFQCLYGEKRYELTKLISYHQFYVLYCLVSFQYGIEKERQRAENVFPLFRLQVLQTRV